MEILEPAFPAKAAILVLHSWWGLTASFRAYGATLRQAGYRVGLADRYDGHCAQTPEEARRLRAGPRRLPIYRSLGADIAALRQGKPDLPLGLAGFSMGGHWAVWLSQRPDYDVDACVLYYAARGGDFSQGKARYLAHFASDDPWVSATARAGMERAMAKAGCRYQAFDYPGTAHWFAESARSEAFHAAAAKQALARDLAFFAQVLARPADLRA